MSDAERESYLRFFEGPKDTWPDVVWRRTDEGSPRIVAVKFTALGTLKEREIVRCEKHDAELRGGAVCPDCKATRSP